MRPDSPFRRVAALALGALLLGSIAAAAAEIALTPLSGSALRTGERAEVRWVSTEPLEFEEWEAFLSLDGGATWPYRLTPHLDREVERFTVELPPEPSSRARLLIRYGDERSEREIELPSDLELLPGRVSAPLLALPSTTVRSSGRRGEAARVGGRGVVEWVDGPRSGEGVVRYRYLPATLGARPTPALLAHLRGSLSLEEAPHPSPRASGAERSPERVVESPVRREQTASHRGRLSTSTRLSLLSRRNE